MTGASGAVYGVRLLQFLLAAGQRVDLILSRAGGLVLWQECNLDWRDPSRGVAAILGDLGEDGPGTPERLRWFNQDDWFAPMASGSGGRRRMVLCPCSMGSVSAIARGASDNLIERAADVAIKEKWPLILVPREMPLSLLHLENLVQLARLGVTIMPAAPGFYHRPREIQEIVDFVVARILDHLGVNHSLAKAWPPGV